MTALAKDAPRANSNGEIIEIPVYQSVHIYAGSLVMVIAGTGYAIPGAATANGVVMGVAVAEADNTGGASGAINVRVKRCDVHLVSKASVSQADVGKLMYVLDDNTVSTAGANSVVAGTCVGKKDATNLWLDVYKKTV